MDSKPKAGKLAKAIIRLARCARQKAVKMHRSVQQKPKKSARNQHPGWYPDLAR